MTVCALKSSQAVCFKVISGSIKVNPGLDGATPACGSGSRATGRYQAKEERTLSSPIRVIRAICTLEFIQPIVKIF